MKLLVLSLALLFVLSSGEALKCNRCVPPSGGSCRNRVEECGYGMDACIRATFLTYPYSYFKRCIKMADCWTLQRFPSVINAYCCNTDLCN